MEHTVEKIDWMISYLQNKVVRTVDLKDFFTIQNDEKKIKVEKINGNEFKYTLKDCVFTVMLEPVEKPKSHFVVTSVSCTRD